MSRLLSGKRALITVALATAAVSAAVATSIASPRKAAGLTARSVYALANRCFALLSQADGRFLTATGTGYVANQPTGRGRLRST